MNRAGRHAGPVANPSRSLTGAYSSELEVGDRVLYRRGRREMDQVGVIEQITRTHYWICTREGESFRVRRYGQCVFYPPPWVIEERAKAVRATWYDAQLRQRMGLMPLANGGLDDESPAGAAATPHERRRRWANARCYR